MRDDTQLTEEQIRQRFLENGASFFSWNSGKNTPNILLMLVERIEKLDAGLREASASSAKLATALNRLTLASIIIAFLSLMAFIVFETIKLKVNAR